MAEIEEKAKQTAKQATKKTTRVVFRAVMKHGIITFLPILLILAIIIIILAAAVYFITVDDGTYKEDDWGNTNYGASQYVNSVSVNSDGTLSNSSTTQELWDKMIENGCRVDKYLDSPEELARLMKAEIVTKYPDMRENPDDEINWQEIVNNSDALQGIIKFKRADSNNKKTTMVYANPEEFQGYIDEYNSTGSDEAKNNALTHFTLKQTSTSTINATEAIAAGEGVMTDVSQAIVDATNITNWPGAERCAQWVNDVCTNAGLTVSRHGSAYADSLVNVISTDKTAIPIGAAVYGTGTGSSGKYGHVGIYIGDGKVVDSVTSGIKTSTLSEWIGWQEQAERNSNNVLVDKNGIEQHGWLGWGWADGNKTRGTTSDTNISQTTNNNSSTNTTTSANLQKSVETEASGDGYSKQYTSSAGITYKLYSQGRGSYAQNKYWDGTIQYSGCGPSSIAILASGILNSSDTPGDVAARMSMTSYDTLKNQMISMGMTGVEVIQSPTAEVIQENLRNGKVMLVSVDKRTIFPNTSSHIMTLLDINTNGEVYVGNPGSSTKYGWYDINEIVKGCKYIVLADAGAAGIASSTNTSSYVAVVATWNETETLIQTNDPNVQEKYGIGEDKASVDHQYMMSTTSVNYQEMVDSYTVPFDLLWAFMVVGEDKKFVFDFADLIYNSDIQITIYDNLTINTDVNNWNYAKRTKTDVDVDIKVNYNDAVTGKPYLEQEKSIHEDNPYGDDIQYNTIKTVIVKTNTISSVLTKANTWIVDYTNDYTYEEPTETGGDENIVPHEDTDFSETPVKVDSGIDLDYTCKEIEDIINKLESNLKEKVIKARQKQQQNEDLSATTNGIISNIDINSVIIPNITKDFKSIKYFEKYIDISDTITNTVNTQKYTKGVADLKEKTDPDAKEDNFVTIYEKAKNYKNRKNIRSVTRWLFEIIESNDSTADMLDLIKYLLYKATGNNYGVEEIEFNKLFTMKTSTAFGTIDGNTVKEQVWNYFKSLGFTDEATAGIMGNMEAESGVDPTSIQGNGAGPAAGICQLENYNTKTGRWKEMADFAASRGKDWTDLQSQLDFLMTELEAQFKSYTGKGVHYYPNGEWCWWPTAMTSDEFGMLTDIEKATEIFCRVYERPSIPHLDRRIESAKGYYNLYHK